MDKILFKEVLLKKQETVIQEFIEKIETVHSMVDLDEENTMDPEDFSHQYESGEMEQLIRVQLSKAKSNLERIRSMNFDQKKSVGVGAIVMTNNLNFFIGMATVPFKFENNDFIGISLESPIFPMMAGKVVNDSFSYGGKNYTIESIY
jgi:hypothetical protein